MGLLSFRLFKGGIPRMPAHALPQNHAKYALNCDLSHADLRGVRDARSIHSNLSVGGAVPRTVYTEDGSKFFAWAQDADVVKSLVVDDIYFRIYYTIFYYDGPLAKVARLQRDDGTDVIGSVALVGGNFQPPENSTPGAGFGNLGPDSWVLGVPQPRVQDDIVEDNLVVTLEDKAAWPSIPRLSLRVTYFWENSVGEQVETVDISNTEVATGTENVFYTNDSAERGNKIQDMLWPLGGSVIGQRPYKYYWFLPPSPGDFALSRKVTITNSNATPFTILYGATVTPPDSEPGGSEGYNYDSGDSGGGAGGG